MGLPSCEILSLCCVTEVLAAACHTFAAKSLLARYDPCRAYTLPVPHVSKR